MADPLKKDSLGRCTGANASTPNGETHKRMIVCPQCMLPFMRKVSVGMSENSPLERTQWHVSLVCDSCARTHTSYYSDEELELLKEDTIAEKRTAEEDMHRAYDRVLDSHLLATDPDLQLLKGEFTLEQLGEGWAA